MYLSKFRYRSGEGVGSLLSKRRNNATIVRLGDTEPDENSGSFAEPVQKALSVSITLTVETKAYDLIN